MNPKPPYVVITDKVHSDVCHRLGELMWNSGVNYPPDTIAARFNEAWSAGYSAATKNARRRRSKPRPSRRERKA